MSFLSIIMATAVVRFLGDCNRINWHFLIMLTVVLSKRCSLGRF